MTVVYQNRYDDSPVVTLAVNSLARRVIVPGPQGDYTFTYTSYQVVGTDRPDTIAYQFFGDASKWYTIADANPEILDWSTMPVGTIIRVPQA